MKAEKAEKVIQLCLKQNKKENLPVLPFNKQLGNK